MKTVRLMVLLGLIGACADGCAAAGLATGPVMSAIQAVSDRSVERTIPAELALVWTALEDVLSRNAIRIEERGQDGDAWRLRGTGEKIAVHARLARVTPRMTRLALRVETGGLLADRTTSEQIHEQIALVFTDPPQRATADSAAALATLENEIRRLRLEIGPRPASPAGPPVRHDAGGEAALAVNRAGIVTIPVSYGLATIPGPIVVATPQPPPRLGATEDSDAPALESATTSPLASPLRPANALRAVPSMTRGVGD